MRKLGPGTLRGVTYLLHVLYSGILAGRGILVTAGKVITVAGEIGDASNNLINELASQNEIIQNKIAHSFSR